MVTKKPVDAAFGARGFFINPYGLGLAFLQVSVAHNQLLVGSNDVQKEHLRASLKRSVLEYIAAFFVPKYFTVNSAEELMTHLPADFTVKTDDLKWPVHASLITSNLPWQQQATARPGNWLLLEGDGMVSCADFSVEIDMGRGISKRFSFGPAPSPDILTGDPVADLRESQRQQEDSDRQRVVVGPILAFQIPVQNHEYVINLDFLAGITTQDGSALIGGGLQINHFRENLQGCCESSLTLLETGAGE